MQSIFSTRDCTDDRSRAIIVSASTTFRSDPQLHALLFDPIEQFRVWLDAWLRIVTEIFIESFDWAFADCF